MAAAPAMSIAAATPTSGRHRPTDRRGRPSHLSLYRPDQRNRPLAYRRSGRRLDASVYRRRRLLVGGLLLLSVAAVLVLAQLIQAGIGGGPLTTTGAAAGPGMVPAGATAYVVRPGDTLWTVAARLDPGRDERPLVDQLARELGGSALYPGQVIPLPATGR